MKVELSRKSWKIKYSTSTKAMSFQLSSIIISDHWSEMYSTAKVSGVNDASREWYSSTALKSPFGWVWYSIRRFSQHGAGRASKAAFWASQSEPSLIQVGFVISSLLVFLTTSRGILYVPMSACYKTLKPTNKKRFDQFHFRFILISVL